MKHLWRAIKNLLLWRRGRREENSAEGDLPALFRDADAASLRAQKRFIRATTGVILGGLLAAVCGAINETEAGFVAAGGFVVALACTLYLLRQKPEERWYDGRVVAEAAKSLGWEFKVGGGDFGRARLDTDEAARQLAEALEEVRSGLRDVAPIPQGPVEQVTSGMRAMRQSNLPTRRNSYAKDRVGRQSNWYSDRSALNERRRTQWAVLGACLQAGGVAGAMAKGFGWIEIDLLGIAAAAGLGVAAWVRAKDYAELARAYAVAVHDLASAKVKVDSAGTEEEFAQAVRDAETAISREHVPWAARRQRR